MINEVIMYTAKCDGCGEEWDNGDGVCAYADREHTRYMVQESGWEIMPDGKTYCPKCFSYDNNDNLHITPPKTNT